MAKRRTTTPPADGRRNDDRGSSPRENEELIVVVRADTGLRTTRGGVESMASADLRGLQNVLGDAGVSLQPLFGASEERVRASMMALPDSADVPEMDKFYYVDAPQEQMEELAESLRELDEVEGAYVKPKGEPPVEAMEAIDRSLNDMAPADEDPPAVTPNFSARQIYLNPAPAGINAKYAWTLHGGRGAGISIIDCEWGWRFTHEDLMLIQGGIVVGSGIADDNHGTAVLGEFSGDRNTFGILGICSDARAMAASFATLPTASVIRQAADKLKRGDIILLEIHRAGPDASGVGQDGYIAIEWWPDDLAAIRYAVAKGIIVVEAAGNGARNLDAPIYNIPRPGFPATWRNPFNTANPTSGAVLVGAGAPPPGTHGRDHGPDRSRLAFSNYGRRVDVQGWGREVTTTGYGDLQGGVNRNLWYTDTFSGTSSASPIVVGALGCVQGILRARLRPLLTPAGARTLLRTTGSPQQDGPGRPKTQRIGNRPDLRQMIAKVIGFAPEESGEIDSRGGENGGGTISGQQVVININSPHTTIHIGSAGGVQTQTSSANLLSRTVVDSSGEAVVTNGHTNGVSVDGEQTEEE
jgi:hypothetical protein